MTTIIDHYRTAAMSHMLIWARHVQDVLFVSFWVGICTVVPEIVWQGGLLVFEHHDTIDILVSATLGSCFLFFFIEPLTERLKHLSWSADHSTNTWTFMRFFLFILFGITAVCLHECIEALINAASVGPQHSNGVDHAVWLMAQWAFVPFVLTFTWIVGKSSKAIGNLLIVIVSVIVFVATLQVFKWHIGSAIVICVISTITSIGVINFSAKNKNSDIKIPGPFPETPYIAAFLLIQLLVFTLACKYFNKSFDGFDSGEDLRFYIGWICGLLFAPRPYYIKKHRENVKAAADRLQWPEEGAPSSADRSRRAPLAG